ncbi:hypothetical protein PHYSODRAFT_338046 [Phytophthora sojae]|uniref:Uncharacterized protein n=1 Tax=Phytophthora sojae (strain P6497) TaxID=1094619 RepID=G5A0E4_PHYSP|nr:hypothetical protein PHYSODRAFT_338046 [Phytophthora sojae]EGZ11333.1 hypothetical protein PHYSODRAFT_338046 [Phytophthora sojae]|eukprot:XP_009534078.1 hypothetical protein PHYSODRAFT_338046 [Phytophthora sojae]
MKATSLRVSTMSSLVAVAAFASGALGDTSLCVQSTSEDSKCTKAGHVTIDVSQNGCYSSCQAYNTQSVDTHDSDCTTPSKTLYAAFLADGKCHRFKTGYVQVVLGKDGTMWALVSDVGCEASLLTSYSLYSFKTTHLDNGDCVSPGSGTSFKATFSGTLPAATTVITGTESTDTTGSTSTTSSTTTDVSTAHTTATSSAASTLGDVRLVTAMAGFISGILLIGV